MHGSSARIGTDAAAGHTQHQRHKSMKKSKLQGRLRRSENFVQLIGNLRDFFRGLHKKKPDEQRKNNYRRHHDDVMSTCNRYPQELKSKPEKSCQPHTNKNKFPEDGAYLNSNQRACPRLAHHSLNDQRRAMPSALRFPVQRELPPHSSCKIRVLLYNAPGTRQPNPQHISVRQLYGIL